ncbi:24298_t:CDS:2 [Gigaspora margarita]|uniref:24298_t:CDS:1 n=1 Tax=Gigaspora margarita TaxID=4874 RepID=A0ABN7UWQ2_GIGMA|nr:24298_t:CDS:2 [Gigaspora margarita]
MFVEAHWKVLKQDFLYKFFCPRLDLYLIQQRDEVTVQFFNQVHRNHQYPFIDTSSLLTDNVEYMALINNDNIEQSITSYQNIDDSQACNKLYTQLIEVIKKTLEILKDQQDKKNYKWAKSVKRNFNSLEQMISEIASLKRRNTIPCTFKDHLHNTLFFN